MTEDQVAAAINDHKGQLIALQAFATSIFRAMSIDMQARALAEWDTETEAARTVLLNSSAPDDLAAAFERYVRMLDVLRIAPPAS